MVGDHDFTLSDAADFTYFIQTVTDHPDYNSITLDSDYSLLKLRTPIEISRTVMPACLPRNDNNKFEGIDAIVSGWGLTKHVSTKVQSKESLVFLSLMWLNFLQGGQQSTVLKATTVHTKPTFQCGLMRTSMSANMICASAEGTDSCQGDSGGKTFIELAAKKS